MESVCVFDEGLVSLINNIWYIQSNLIYSSTRLIKKNNCFVQTLLHLKMRPPRPNNGIFRYALQDARIGPEWVPRY